MASVESSAPDALALRRAIYGQGDPTRGDLESLLAGGPSEDAGFCALVADVATDVCVHQGRPQGYVTESDAAWLIAHLRHLGGQVEFAVLRAIIAHAIQVPPALTAFAVREIEKAILTGRRDPTDPAERAQGVVTREDVETLRAFVFAPTRGSSQHVDRATAEALFDIAHATATADNAPEFADVFARAVGNHLMGVAFLGTPDAAQVLAHEKALEGPTSFGGFVSAMMRRPTRSDLGDALESVDGETEDAVAAINDETDRQLASAERIDAGQAKWILAHLTRGGELTQAEKRLLGFLRDEAASAPPELTALYDKAA